MVIGYSASDSRMDPGLVEVAFELVELSLQIIRVPIEEMVQILASDSSDEPFHERMRDGHMGHCGHGVDAKDAEVGFPLKELKEWIVIEAQSRRRNCFGYGVIEHSAESGAIDSDGLDRKPDDASRILVHHHQNPMSFEGDRLRPKQVDTPETVFGVPQHGDP